MAASFCLLCTTMLVGCPAPDEASAATAAVTKTAATRATTAQAAIASRATTDGTTLPEDPALASSGASRFFSGRREATVGELFTAMSAQAEALGTSSILRKEYEALLARHRVQGDDALYLDFLKIRMAFEATRAGGWWGLEWQVTDREPQSDAIWPQWRALKVADGTDFPSTTAIAECDELSALFAVVAHGMSLSKRSQVGLLWPTSNHTVAVWMIRDRNGRELARIVVPTSQIFLDNAQSLDTQGFDPSRQSKIYDYRRQDIAKDARMPAPLLRYFLDQNQRLGGLSRDELQRMRNRRADEQRRNAGR
jgi:hypothetical protein